MIIGPTDWRFEIFFAVGIVSCQCRFSLLFVYRLWGGGRGDVTVTRVFHHDYNQLPGTVSDLQDLVRLPGPGETS